MAAEKDSFAWQCMYIVYLVCIRWLETKLEGQNTRMHFKHFAE